MFVDVQANARVSEILIQQALLEGEKFLTRVVTHMDRDHLITLSAEHRSLMIANVHLELRSNLRNFRGRLREIHEHWPRYSAGLGFLIL